MADFVLEVAKYPKSSHKIYRLLGDIFHSQSLHCCSSHALDQTQVKVGFTEATRRLAICACQQTRAQTWCGFLLNLFRSKRVRLMETSKLAVHNCESIYVGCQCLCLHHVAWLWLSSVLCWSAYVHGLICILFLAIRTLVC